MKTTSPILALLLSVAVARAADPTAPLAESWDYAPAMKKVAAQFTGKEGVVLHIGDSMTIANPYSQWARSGKGKTPEDEAILKWMHAGKNDKTDGWWLCRTEVIHERAYTSVGGMQSTHLLAGGNRDNPPLAAMLKDFAPRMVIIQVGIYDTDGKRPAAEYKANMAKAVDQVLANGTICILSTCAPLHNRLELSKEHNQALRDIAKERGLPLIDFEREVLTRRPDDWNGTLQRRNNIHLTASEAGGNSGAAPTDENLGKSGYLLRGWLSVQKIAEVKRRVLDAPKEAPGAGAGKLAEQLAKFDGRVIELGTVRQPPLAPMLANDARAGLREANQADRRAWEQVKNRAEWERFRDARLQALRTTLGQYPAPAKAIKQRVTRTLEGDGYRVDNLVFESRPGLVVTANLYRPTKTAPSMPALILCHSHQAPKNTAARQDMAMTWARAGCVVLVPDHLGHGERRQHPYATATDFPRAFAAPRQDYWFRYDTSMQLDLIGDSLMGWFVWDLARGVDVLLAQPGVDPKRVVIVSEPAGGGDVAAVAAALDSRITGAVITNFGGPQPETAYPLPRDAEQSFDYAGSGSWESTRNLRNSARDGVLHWLLMAAPAPRRVVYNHEFYWDRENDPVWKRLQKVYGFYDGDNLVGIGARGFVVGSEPENMHWIAGNRELLYPTFERWFNIPNPKKEFSNRRPPEDFLCLTPAALEEFAPQPMHQIAARLGAERAAAARTELHRLSDKDRRAKLRQDWTKLLGNVAAKSDPVVRDQRSDDAALPGVQVERIHLATEPGIVVPVLLLRPATAKGKLPLVVAVAQGGKQEFLKQRSEAIAELLAGGTAVCLPDVRGTGETSPGAGRDRGSPATAISASALMLGTPLLGGRLRDLDAVLRHLRQRPDVDRQRIALWGDSFAAPNAGAGDLRAPHGIDNRPGQSEPLGGLLALLGALFHDDVRAVYAQGGLSSYQSVLQSQCCHLPHDVIVPGVLTTGDLADVAAVLAPRPLRLEGLVDGLNRRVAPEALAKMYESTRTTYRTAGAEAKLAIAAAQEDPARWLLAQLKGN